MAVALLSLLLSFLALYVKIDFWGGTRYAPFYVKAGFWYVIAAGPVAVWQRLTRPLISLVIVAAQLALLALAAS